MVLQVSKLLLSLALAALVTVQAEQAPAFDVPSFDYATLSSGNTPSLLLDALKKDGIITLKNIPSYAATREAYLSQAAACAVVAKDASAEFLLHKTLAGGVKRYTISTASGQELDTSALAATTEATCPGYTKIYSDFTGILERAVASLADTLDATGFTTQDGYANAVSTRKLFGEAVRLDHFHAYEAPQATARQLSTTDDLSLPLHEDDGMFIVFPTPAFYKVKSDGSLEAVTAGASDADSGLVIETQDHQRVRPVLKADEVTVMVGTGFNKWVTTSDKLPAVTHGMQMPASNTPLAASERLLRSWFGKMTLLPSYHRMLSHMTFEQHANATSRFLKQDAEVDMMTIGCAPGRKLVASATPECSFNDCTTKAGASAPSEGCSVVCNRNHDGDAALCSASCSCTASSHRATTCWMLCVKDLDSCATTDQVCSGQSLVCNATPAPTTKTPTTPAPTTQPPSTPAPSTKTPATQAPSTQAPTTPTPTTQSPGTPTPTTKTPGTTPSPTTGSPSTPAPSTIRPGC